MCFWTSRELKDEARRILAYDSISHLMEEKEPPVDLTDWEAIGNDVQQALEESSRLIESPELGDVCGVRVADGLVPKSLHRVVSFDLPSFPPPLPRARAHSLLSYASLSA